MCCYVVMYGHVALLLCRYVVMSSRVAMCRYVASVVSVVMSLCRHRRPVRCWSLGHASGDDCAPRETEAGKDGNGHTQLPCLKQAGYATHIK